MRRRGCGEEQFHGISVRLITRQETTETGGFLSHDKEGGKRVTCRKSAASVPSFPSLPGSLIPVDLDFQGSLMTDNLAHLYNRRKS